MTKNIPFIPVPHFPMPSDKNKIVDSIYKLIACVETDDRVQDRFDKMYTVIRVCEEDMSGPKMIALVGEFWNTSLYTSYSNATEPVFVRVFSQHESLFRNNLSPRIVGKLKVVLDGY